VKCMGRRIHRSLPGIYPPFPSTYPLSWMHNYAGRHRSGKNCLLNSQQGDRDCVMVPTSQKTLIRRRDLLHQLPNSGPWHLFSEGFPSLQEMRLPKHCSRSFVPPTSAHHRIQAVCSHSRYSGGGLRVTFQTLLEMYVRWCWKVGRSMGQCVSRHLVKESTSV